MKKIDLEKCIISIQDNGIIKLETKENVSMNQEDLMLIERFYQEKLKIESGLFLIVFSKNLKGDFNAKKHFVSFNDKKIKRAEAIVMREVSHQVESNYFLKNKMAEYPIKVFDNEKDAETWLLLH